MFEPEELMARIVDLEAQLKVSEMAPPAAEQLIACLEGEIAKRDARIVELELTVFQLNNSVTSHHWENTALRAELAALKAQDTVGEVVGWYRLDRPYEMTSYPSVCATWHKLGAPVAPLYAAPVSEAKAQEEGK